jgi:GIY-YIG catalytic domain
LKKALLIMNVKKSGMPNSKKKLTDREKDRRRSTFFCIGVSKAWMVPIHQTIREVKKKYNLGWLRVSMSYHRFTNLREMFQGDLSKKLTADVISMDFETLGCNCRLGLNGKCGYNNNCRKSIVVYKIECKNTSKVYIGNTQQHFKKRMQQHFNDVKKLHQHGIKSDSYAKHFSLQLSNFDNPTPKIQRNSISCEILWQGNPINVVKTFGTPNCALCNKERLEILKQSKKDPNSLINSCNEIYGACRHNSKFHRYKSRPSSTDESNIDERVTLTKTTTKVDMMCGKCLTEV